MTWPSTRTLLTAGVVVIVIASIATGGWLWSRAGQQAARQAYAAASTRVQAARGPGANAEVRAAARRELEAVLDRYPSAPWVAEATYELGNLRFEAKEYATAREAYGRALAAGASPTIRRLARVGIGYTWEAEGDYAKAIDVYQGALGDLKPGDFLWDELVIALARVQELAGRKAEAIASYRRLLAEAPGSPRAEEVRMRLASLGVGPTGP